MNIYVGNLSAEVTEDDLRQLFSELGEITSIKVISDRFTGEARGFGFVEMPSNQDATAAIEKLDGTELKGKLIIVNKARERAKGGTRGGSGGGRGGSGGGFNRRGRY